MILVIMNIGYYWHWDRTTEKTKTHYLFKNIQSQNRIMKKWGVMGDLSMLVNEECILLHVRLLILILNLEVIWENGGMMF